MDDIHCALAAMAIFLTHMEYQSSQLSVYNNYNHMLKVLHKAGVLKQSVVNVTCHFKQNIAIKRI